MSRTHGPRMNRDRTREVVDKLAIHVVKSNGHGIEIHRTVGPGISERWRLYTGGGIAGNSDQVWLAAIVYAHGYTPRGPYWNKTQLEKALRVWRREGRDLAGATITDAQIRDLSAMLLSGPADARQLHGLVDCHDALGRSHRREAARLRSAELLADVQRPAHTAERPVPHA